MKLLHLKGVPVLEQLRLEEALLRASDEDICLINEGSPPAIVMGISGKPHELIDLEKLARSPIPVIKRYSGGGTVVVDQSTLFVSFICNKSRVEFTPYPEPLMRWSAALYKKSWPTLDFNLRENDYVIGERKIGGNAQYLTKNRFVHHTSFLWDYREDLMDLLLHPPKTPHYRAGRSHREFITTLSEHSSDRDELVRAWKKLVSHTFKASCCLKEEVVEVLSKEHRKSTSILSHHTLY